jgi:hypothetical protein
MAAPVTRSVLRDQPESAEIANRDFTFLKDTPAKVEVALATAGWFLKANPLNLVNCSTSCDDASPETPCPST